MSDFDKIEKGLCPNNCGGLNFFWKPIPLLHLLPEDILDLAQLEGVETPDDMFGYLVGVCAKCGFMLSSPPTYEYDYDNYKWIRISSDSTPTPKGEQT